MATALVTGKVSKASSAAGTVTFTPTQWAGWPAAGVVQGPSAVTATVAADGSFSATLWRTDDAEPPTWVYRVVFNVPSVSAEPFHIRVDGPGNIADMLAQGEMPSWSPGAPPWSAPDGRYSLLGHTHDDRYYTESEMDQMLATLASGGTVTVNEWWRGNSPLGQSATLDGLDTGVYTVWSGAVAEAMGLPVVTQGTLEIAKWGARGGVARFTTRSLRPAMWVNSLMSGGWSGWVRIGPADPSTPSLPDAALTPRLVPLALTVGAGGTPWTSGVLGIRMPVRFGRPLPRWRVHVRNWNPRYGITRAGAVAMTGLWVGPGNFASGDWSATPRLVVGSFSLPADGSEWVSAWQDTPIPADADWMLAYGMGGSHPGMAHLVGGGWSTTVAAAATRGAAAWRRVTLPLDVWIEAEVSADTPVIAAFGPSTAAGVGATLPVHDSPVSIYCRGAGALPVHYAASGDSAQSWASNPDAGKWRRWDHLDRPDTVIFTMSSNDVHSSRPLAEVQQDMQTCLDLVAARLSPSIAVATFPPRDGETAENRTKRRALNTWIKGVPSPARRWLDFVSPLSTDDASLIPALTSDGTHYTTAGSAALAASITPPLIPASQPPPPVPEPLPIREGVGWFTLADDPTIRLEVLRAGQVVTVTGSRIAHPAGAGALQLTTLPARYRPTSDVFTTTMRGRVVRATNTGALTVTDPDPSVDHFSLTYITTAA